MKDYIVERDIEYLFHFTRVENIASIFINGIVPLDNLLMKNYHVLRNDLDRADNCSDASCFSISFPNYKCFYTMRKRYAKSQWAVLAISPNVLWEKDCLFNYTNAANNDVRFMNRDEKRGLSALKRLYYDIPGRATRIETQIPKSYPTDPQAEVCIIGTVEPKYILGVAFNDHIIQKKYGEIVPQHIQNIVAPQYFDYRMDSRFWFDEVKYG